ncbi:transcriptional regulator [Mycobacterium tuberculosis T46]|nr:transcriptional regulator [Mycobacterium tuberculosis T46]
MEAARRLIARSGADAITMDDVAAAAGVGKGTLFRRFGSRAGLMMVLLDEDERASQQAFLFGPPPLGPDAPPLDRLIAFGRERMRFVHAHHQLLSEANRDPQTRHSAALSVLRTHLRVLLASAPTTGDLDAQTDALLALRRRRRRARAAHPAAVRWAVPGLADRRRRTVRTMIDHYADSSTAMDPARRPRPVFGVGRTAPPPRTGRFAGHRRRQR